MSQTERTIADLLMPGTKYYFWLEDRETARQFMKDAERDGITFDDGELPTKRKPDEIMAIHSDKTLYYLGFVGRMAYNADNSPHTLRVDYKRYKAGESYYYIEHHFKDCLSYEQPRIEDNRMLAGNAAILVWDQDLRENDAFFRWLHGEGFEQWEHSDDWRRGVCWIYVNLKSRLYAIGTPGRLQEGCLGGHGVTIDEFQTIYRIFRKYEGLAPLQF